MTKQQEQCAQPLKWRKPNEWDCGHENSLWVADGLGGKYAITEGIGTQYELWWAHDELDYVTCNSLEQAKDQAEIDWQERFAGLITRTTPAPDNAALVDECLQAVAGKGPRTLDWQDKPHRLIYDLCAALAASPRQSGGDHIADAGKMVPERTGDVVEAEKYAAKGDWNGAYHCLRAALASSRESVLEECAKVVEKHEVQEGWGDCVTISKAIRALKNKGEVE